MLCYITGSFGIFSMVRLPNLNTKTSRNYAKSLKRQPWNVAVALRTVEEPGSAAFPKIQRRSQTTKKLEAQFSDTPANTTLIRESTPSKSTTSKNAQNARKYETRLDFNRGSSAYRAKLADWRAGRQSQAGGGSAVEMFRCSAAYCATRAVNHRIWLLGPRREDRPIVNCCFTELRVVRRRFDWQFC